MEFIENHQPVFILILTIFSVLMLGLLAYVTTRVRKIVSNLVTNRFRVKDLNEQAENDAEPLFTLVFSNHAMNAVSVISIGFCLHGSYYNFYDTCKAQMRMEGSNLSLLPRSHVKLQVTKERLETLLFQNMPGKKLGALKGYLIGSAGETYQVKLKTLRKFVERDYEIARKRRIEELKRQGLDPKTDPVLTGTFTPPKAAAAAEQEPAEPQAPKCAAASEPETTALRIAAEPAVPVTETAETDKQEE